MALQKNRPNATAGVLAARRAHGMTLIELVIAIVIISLGLAGVLTVYATTVKQSADPMLRKQMVSIAEEMLAEVTTQSYEALANATPAACARDLYNDSLDYHGYNSASCLPGGPRIYDRGGLPVAHLERYAVQVAVNAETWQGIPAQKIVVTVSSPQGESITLTSWRTEWGT